MLLDHALLEPSARRFRGLALGQVGEQQHEAQIAVLAGEDRVGADQQRHWLTVGAIHRNLAPPAAPLDYQCVQRAPGFFGLDQELCQVGDR